MGFIYAKFAVITISYKNSLDYLQISFPYRSFLVFIYIGAALSIDIFKKIGYQM